MYQGRQKNTGLTDRQGDVLQMIVDQIEQYGYPPTVRELRDELGVNSIRGASIHLDALERKGFIERTGKARGIRVLRRIDNTNTPQEIRIPLIGQIQAGRPILAEENIDQYINVHRDYLNGYQQAFALRVKGESMIDAGIHPSDIALITPTQTAQNGDIVVALFEDSATLKKYHQVDNYIALLPANPKFEPIIGKDFSIQGKLITVLHTDGQRTARLSDDATLVPVYPIDTADTLQHLDPMVKWVYGRTVD